MIRFENFSFSYGNSEIQHLKNLNFTIEPGEFVLLCGRSACGKTTAAKCINGLIPHFTEGKVSGKVFVKDREVAQTPSYVMAEQVGSVFQNPKTQFFNLDSDSELVFGMENLGIAPEQIKERVKTVTEDLKIENLLGRNVFRLSGGEKQILALASVYAVGPDIFVLDEPTANIDPEGIERLHDILKKLKDMGKTVVISEHRLYFLMDLIDKAVYIDHGAVQNIYPGDVFRKMSDEERIRLGLRCFRLEKQEKSVNEGDDRQLLAVQDLSIRFKHKTLMEHVSLTAAPGDIIAVTGPNGSGKSSFLRVLCGLMKESGGSISYDGVKTGYKKRRNLCYMTMQDVVHQLFADSILEEFALLNREVEEEKILAILKKLDLLDYKDKHPMTLSGGQKQRLALAVAAIADKPILLFDEPTSGLDYGNMSKVSELIREISRDKIVFVATNDRELINVLCTREIEIGE